MTLITNPNNLAWAAAFCGLLGFCIVLWIAFRYGKADAFTEVESEEARKAHDVIVQAIKDDSKNQQLPDDELRKKLES